MRETSVTIKRTQTQTNGRFSLCRSMAGPFMPLSALLRVDTDGRPLREHPGGAPGRGRGGGGAGRGAPRQHPQVPSAPLQEVAHCPLVVNCDKCKHVENLFQRNPVTNLPRSTRPSHLPPPLHTDTKALAGISQATGEGGLVVLVQNLIYSPLTIVSRLCPVALPLGMGQDAPAGRAVLARAPEPGPLPRLPR